MLIQPIQQPFSGFRHTPNRNGAAGGLIDFREHGPRVVSQQVFMTRGSNQDIACMS